MNHGGPSIRPGRTSDGRATAGLEVRELAGLDELKAAFDLFDSIWRFDPGAPIITVELMRALSYAGNYVAGAYRDGRLVGASVGFFAGSADRELHSHITGAAMGRGIGLELKLHQRRWALERGLSRITWTYDPLVRRNAHFNLVKLGARPAAYLPSFYGTIGDAINSGDETDRLLVAWRLAEPAAVDAARRIPRVPEVPADAAPGLIERDGLPVLGSTDAATVLVALPADIETMRRQDPGAARAWRRAVRQVLGGLIEQGAQVTGFHHKSSYVVRQARRGL